MHTSNIYFFIRDEQVLKKKNQRCFFLMIDRRIWSHLNNLTPRTDFFQNFFYVNWQKNSLKKISQNTHTLYVFIQTSMDTCTWVCVLNTYIHTYACTHLYAIPTWKHLYVCTLQLYACTHLCVYPTHVCMHIYVYSTSMCTHLPVCTLHSVCPCSYEQTYHLCVLAYIYYKHCMPAIRNLSIWKCSR